MSRQSPYKEVNRLEFECDLWSREFTLIAGVDEAGRGPLAGPVVAAVVLSAASFSIAPLKSARDCLDYCHDRSQSY